MSDRPASFIAVPEGYAAWLQDLKTRIHSAQQRARPFRISRRASSSPSTWGSWAFTTKP